MNRTLLALVLLALAAPAAKALPPLCTAPGWCEPENPDIVCSCSNRPKVVTCGNPSACYQTLAQLPVETSTCAAVETPALDLPALGISVSD